MKRSVGFILAACFWLAASAGFATAPPYAGTKLFEDTFDGASGSPPNAAYWTSDNGGALDGSGNYVKTDAVGAWLPVLVGKAEVVPGAGAHDIQVEFRLNKTAGGHFYVGLYPSAGAANTLARCYFVENTYGRINVDTDLIGTGAVPGAPADDYSGIPTSASYSNWIPDTNVGLIMILKTTGVMEYWYDNGAGGGYTQLTITGGTQSVKDILNSWKIGTPPSYHIKVTPYGVKATDTFKVDRITVTQVGQAPGRKPKE